MQAKLNPAGYPFESLAQPGLNYKLQLSCAYMTGLLGLRSLNFSMS